MHKWKNINLDDETMWPKEGLVKLDAPHTDDRGYIQSLVNFPMKNISLISSKKGSVRSNHYHLTDCITCMFYLVLLTIILDLQIVMKKFSGN